MVYLLPLIIGGVLIFLLWDQRPQFIKSWMDPAIITSQAGMFHERTKVGLLELLEARDILDLLLHVQRSIKIKIYNTIIKCFLTQTAQT